MLKFFSKWRNSSLNTLGPHLPEDSYKQVGASLQESDTFLVQACTSVAKVNALIENLQHPIILCFAAECTKEEVAQVMPLLNRYISVSFEAETTNDVITTITEACARTLRVIVLPNHPRIKKAAFLARKLEPFTCIAITKNTREETAYTVAKNLKEHTFLIPESGISPTLMATIASGMGKNTKILFDPNMSVEAMVAAAKNVTEKVTLILPKGILPTDAKNIANNLAANNLIAIQPQTNPLSVTEIASNLGKQTNLLMHNSATEQEILDVFMMLGDEVRLVLPTLYDFVPEDMLLKSLASKNSAQILTYEEFRSSEPMNVEVAGFAMG